MPDNLPIAQKAKQEQTEIVLWDVSNPRSLINLVPENLARRARDLQFEKPEYFATPEKELLGIFKANKDLRPSVTISRMRLKLWEEYDRTQALNLPKMDMRKIYAGICAQETFDALLNYNHNLAWLFCPPTNYLIVLEESLLYGIDQLHEILEAPIVDPKSGTFNTRLAELKVKITFALDERLNGSTPIKIEQISKNLNMSINTSDKGLQKMVEEMSEEELRKTLETLKKRERKKERDIEAEVTTLE